MTNADRIAALLRAFAVKKFAEDGGVDEVDAEAIREIADHLAQVGVLDTAGLSDAELRDLAYDDTYDEIRATLRRLASGEPA